jgi:hypothetical protein
MVLCSSMLASTELSRKLTSGALRLASINSVRTGPSGGENWLEFAGDWVN